MSDPNMLWDGQKWLRWDGHEWVPDPGTPALQPVRKSHTGIIIGAVAVVVVFALLLGGAAFWLIRSRDGTTPAGDTATSITTVPINGTQDSFTDPVGTDQQITPKTTRQPVTVPGGEVGLYGGTKNVSSCDRRQLISYLMANPDKGQAWAGVLGIPYEEIPTFVMKLTPMLLRSDTLVTNHGFRDGRATAFTSVLQAGTAVLVGRRGLPLVRCYCGNPLTPPPAQVPDVTYVGPTWPGWNPQSITVIIQNTTFIDIFVVIDVTTGDKFTRPQGTAGGADSTPGAATQTPGTPGTTSGTSRQVKDVTGFLDAVMNGDYGAADSYCTSNFIGRYGGSANMAPPNWGALTSYSINGTYVGDTFVAVYVEEYWEGGYRQSTYYVTKTGGTYIDDADFVDTDQSYTEEPYTEEPYTEEPYTEDPYTEDPYTEEPYDYPSDYPTQYPDNGEIPDDSVG